MSNKQAWLIKYVAWYWLINVISAEVKHENSTVLCWIIEVKHREKSPLSSRFSSLIINRYLLSRTRSLLEGHIATFFQACSPLPNDSHDDLHQKSNCTIANKQNKERKASNILFFFFYVSILFSLLGLQAKDLCHAIHILYIPCSLQLHTFCSAMGRKQNPGKASTQLVGNFIYKQYPPGGVQFQLLINYPTLSFYLLHE